MGAMKNWSLVCEELEAARTHWESCEAMRRQADVNEAEAYDRLRAAQREHDAMVREQLTGVQS